MTYQTVLITGASGFIATHIVAPFLKASYRVRATLRSSAAAEKVRKMFPEYAAKGSLTFFIVPDTATPNVYDQVVEGMTGVIHTAAPPVQPQVEDNERDLLRPTIEGTRSILNSIKYHAPNVRRVAITSSFAAMMDIAKAENPGYTYTERDWNPISYAEGADPSTPGVVAYLAAKSLAEREAWEFVARERPPWDLATICPVMVLGPTLNATADLARFDNSSAHVYELMAPTCKPSDPVPRIPWVSWV